LKLFTVWSEQPVLSGGTERIMWWRIRGSSINADDDVIEGFSSLEKWEQQALAEALGQFFTEDEAEALSSFLYKHMPDASVHIEPLSVPVNAGYLHLSQIEFREQTCIYIFGETPFGESPLPDIRGSFINEESSGLSEWERPENWIKSKARRIIQTRTENESEAEHGSVEEYKAMSLEEIKLKWPDMNRVERIRFMSTYEMGLKEDDEDRRIIEFLMDFDDPAASHLLLWMIMGLKDRKAALRLLTASLKRDSMDDVEKGAAYFLTHYKALEHLHDIDAAPFLKARLSEMFVRDGLYKKGFSRYPGVFVNHLALDFVYALKALCVIEPKEEYVKLLGGFGSHPSEDVAIAAKALLESLPESEAGEGS